MAFEKRWERTEDTPFTSDGTAQGRLTVVNNYQFKVKMIVVISATGLDNMRLEVKEVGSDENTIYLGPLNTKIRERIDISAYTVALNASIYAEEQSRSKVPEQEVERITYEEEPVVARRVVLVDQYGNKISDDNPLPVSKVGAFTDLSGTATTIASQIAAANADRRYFYIQNNSTGTIWFNFSIDAVTDQPSIELGPGDEWSMSGSFISTESISVIAESAIRNFTAKEG